jgi:hypothetical protein
MLQNTDVFLTDVKWKRGLFSPNFASGNKTVLLLLLLLRRCLFSFYYKEKNHYYKTLKLLTFYSRIY